MSFDKETWGLKVTTAFGFKKLDFEILLESGNGGK